MRSITPKYKFTYWITSFSLLIGTALPSLAITVEEVPNPKQDGSGWVTDMADILSNNTETQLNKLISQLERENGAEIAVVTVPETTPSATPKEFTTELFNYWGIGKADEDNGVLFLVSTEDRRVEIETGYGIAKVLPDTKVGQIIDTEITPQFKQENYDDGTLAGTQALIDTLKTQKNSTSEQTTSEQSKISQEEIENLTETESNNFFKKPLFFGLIVILIALGVISNNRRHRHRGAGGRNSTNSIVGSNSANSGGSSSGSSGGSFGGGSSGGGGAGGSY